MSAPKLPPRPIRIEGDIAYVPLTQGYEATIDAADVPLVAGFNWHAVVARRADGSVRSVYASRAHYADGKTVQVKMHRELTGAANGLEVDHVDGDGLNNRRFNIRDATTGQNQRNAKRRVDNVSGLKGVFWRPVERKWCAQINVEGRRHHLGSFTSRDDAAAAYARASAELHGPYGRTA